ncbi:hypothetical protein DAPPUDRAFT_116683 [Daphnia pulex]|uniref:Ty3 transposon capsid-like protein domain-containing protein n=1 Tax=Daphnia pulex TaxID=6669 RepID=E9HQ51_DAPPU|nr:hypothetical protein DAPPUDRAFT_116683 [Daphnia pulex]|eukprot:EFX66137.1 hypothetical protein DAPPUDRAFT_116683 [Daphnia pulex]
MTSTPPPPPTAPIQIPLNQQQGPRAPSPDPNNVPLTKSHLRELYSQDERKSIPVYKGKRGDQLIHNWLKDAKRVAQSAGWNAKDKIKYFSDRLRGDAADWHSDYIDHAADKEDYDAWEKAIISRFLTETEIENLKKQLNELKQMPDQSTQTYVSRLNHLYDIIHGKEIVLDETIAPPEAVVLARSLRKIRGEAKQKILLKGLLPKIVQAVWTRINVNSHYEDVCEIVYAAETIVNRMEQNEEKNIDEGCILGLLISSQLTRLLLTPVNVVLVIHENELRNLIIPPLSKCSISIATPPQLDLAGVPVEQKENLKNLLLSYFSLFTENINELGKAKSIKHSIHTTQLPDVMPMRRTPKRLRLVVKTD